MDIDKILDIILHIFNHPLFSKATIMAIWAIILKLFELYLNKNPKIRTEQSLETYSKLQDAMHKAASPFVGYFVTILKKFDELTLSSKEINENDLKSLLNEYFEPAFKNDGYLGIKDIITFNNQIISGSSGK